MAENKMQPKIKVNAMASSGQTPFIKELGSVRA
jgi:hypothetical protein